MLHRKWPRLAYLGLAAIGVAISCLLSAEPRHRTLAELQGDPVAITTMSDGRIAVVQSTGEIWDVTNARPLARVALDAALTSACFHHTNEGLEIFCGDMDGQLYRGAQSNDFDCHPCLSCKPGPAIAIRILPEVSGAKIAMDSSNKLAIAELDCQAAVLFDRESPKSYRHGTAVLRKCVLSCGLRGPAIEVQSRTTNAQFRDFSLDGLDGNPECLVAVHDTPFVLCGTRGGNILCISEEPIAIKWRVKTGYSPVTDIVIADNGVVVTCTLFNEISLWRLDDRSMVRLMSRRCNARLMVACAANKENRIVIGLEGGRLEEWRF